MEKTLDISSLSREIKLLFYLLNQQSDLDLINDELFAEINWDEFLQLVIHHRVYPIIYKRIKGKYEERIPSKLLRKLHMEYQRNIFLMLHLSGEMEQIGRVFAEKEISLQMKEFGFCLP